MFETFINDAETLIMMCVVWGLLILSFDTDRLKINKRCNIKTTGKIVDVNIDYLGTGRGGGTKSIMIFVPVYEFEVGGKKRKEKGQYVTSCANINIGSDYEIKYNENNPSEVYAPSLYAPVPLHIFMQKVNVVVFVVGMIFLILRDICLY